MKSSPFRSHIAVCSSRFWLFFWMSSPDPLYPAKRTPSPGGNFTIRQFFLPIRLNGEEIWALLDTGAHISILPKEVADEVLHHYNSPVNEGTYPLARLVNVPFHSYELDFQILEHIDGTIPELDIMPYAEESRETARLRNIEFQVPDLTWAEIGERLNAEDPVSIHAEGFNYVILGLYGVIDQLSVSFVGDNSVTVTPIGPE